MYRRGGWLRPALALALLLIVAAGFWSWWSLRRVPPVGAIPGATHSTGVKQEATAGAAAQGPAAGAQKPGEAARPVWPAGRTGNSEEEPVAAQPRPGSGTRVAPQSAAVELLVTRDFGRVTLVSASAKPVAGQTVLDVLSAHARVDTAYGGNFVNAINGLATSATGPGGRQDWFFYVNGVASPTGAGVERVGPGDAVWWDYHTWDASGLVPAVVGSYPAPFTRTYGGAGSHPVVVYGADSRDEAVRLQAGWSRQGISADLAPVEEKLLAERQAPTVVLATWSEVKNIPFLQHLSANGARSGLFGRFEAGGSLVLLDRHGRDSRTLAEGAVVLATGSGLGDAASLWLVLGSERAWLAKAVDLLLGERSTLKGAYGLALGSEGVIHLPVTNK